MEFIIRRASCYSYEADKPPVPEAVTKMVPCYDQRLYKTAEEHDADHGQRWYSRGTEHTVNEIGIVRRLGDNPEWVIQINTLEELMQLQQREDESLVVSKDTIIIYDDYLE